MNTPDPASPREFVEFWAQRYYGSHEDLYTTNINRPPTDETLTALFKGKIGAWLFARTLERTVKPKFLERIEEARALPPDAGAFLKAFADGGALFPIFWLFCWPPPGAPISDQLVPRAMVFIRDRLVEKLCLFRFEPNI